VYLLEIGSGEVRRLTTRLEVHGQASWSGDGRRLLVSGRATAVDEVYVVTLDGTIRRLTTGTEGTR
jgi:hypothetical protein